MIHCQNCGQGNAPESQFCRFCGTKFLASQPVSQQGYDYGAPRPYSWKTDEYQTHADPRPKPPDAWNPAGAGPLAVSNQQFTTGNYRCPNCMSQFLPRIERRISTTGWIVFAVLLVVFFPLFWVGLLIKEDVHVCPSCNTRVK
ncbi:MAG TPA: LITAF-like zinc ribbon domain-containing protein [Pyrinomonadaceae bacterium]